MSRPSTTTILRDGTATNELSNSMSNMSHSRQQQQQQQPRQQRTNQRVRFDLSDEDATYTGSSSGSGSGDGVLGSESDNYYNSSTSTIGNNDGRVVVLNSNHRFEEQQTGGIYQISYSPVPHVEHGSNNSTNANIDYDESNNNDADRSGRILLQMGGVSVMMLLFVMVSVAHLAVRYNSSETSTVPNFPDHLNLHNNNNGQHLDIASPTSLITTADADKEADDVVVPPIAPSTTIETVTENTPDAGIIVLPIVSSDDHDVNDDEISSSDEGSSTSTFNGAIIGRYNNNMTTDEETLSNYYEFSNVSTSNNTVTTLDHDDSDEENFELLKAAVSSDNITITGSTIDSFVEEQQEEYDDALNQNFDLFLFDMRYVPGFCSIHDSDTYEACRNPNQTYTTRLTIHGLWPNMSNGEYPQFCSRPNNDDTILDPKVVQDLAQEFIFYWPDEKNPNVNDPMEMMELYKHEWARHGTCTNLTQKEYFISAFDSYHNPNPSTLIRDYYGKDIAQETLRLAFETMTTAPNFVPSSTTTSTTGSSSSLRGKASTSDQLSTERDHATSTATATRSSVMLFCSTSSTSGDKNDILQEVVICVSKNEKGAPGNAISCPQGVIDAHKHDICQGDRITLPKFQNSGGGSSSSSSKGTTVNNDVDSLDEHTNSLL